MLKLNDTDGIRATLFHCHKEMSMDLVSFYQNVLCLPAPWYRTMQECMMLGAESLTGVSMRKLERIRSLAVERGLGRREAQPLSRAGLCKAQVLHHRLRPEGEERL